MRFASNGSGFSQNSLIRKENLEPARRIDVYTSRVFLVALGVNHSQGHPGFSQVKEVQAEGPERPVREYTDFVCPSRSAPFDERAIRYVEHSKDPL